MRYHISDIGFKCHRRKTSIFYSISQWDPLNLLRITTICEQSKHILELKNKIKKYMHQNLEAIILLIYITLY